MYSAGILWSDDFQVEFRGFLLETYGARDLWKSLLMGQTNLACKMFFVSSTSHLSIP